MCFKGINRFALVLTVAFASQLCEAKNWRRVNTTCPALEQCECNLLKSGAAVRCANFMQTVEWQNGTDLKEDMDKLRNTTIRTLTLSGINVDVLPASWFPSLTVSILIINHSPLKSIEDNAFKGIKKVSRVILENNRLTAIPRALKSFKVIKSLHIPRNFLRSVDDELDSLGELIELNLRFNLIEKISEGAFKNQLRLQKLQLQNNRLEDIPALLFKNTKRLEHIDLHNNRIKTIGDSISGLPSLKIAYVYNNEITELDKFVQANHDSLKSLRAENNLITSVAEFGSANTMIETIFFRNCSIYYIHPLAFAALERLTQLDLGSNRISYINGSAFHKSLENCNLAENRITSLSGTFDRTRRMLHLNLSHNSIEDISEAFTKLENLKKLSLNNNRIRYIRGGTFRANSNLHDLNLGENSIEWLGQRAFEGLVSLRKLLIDHNSLLRLNGSVSHMPQLYILHMYHNGLMSLDKNDFVNVGRLAYIYAFRNNIRRVDGAFSRLGNLKAVALQSNQLSTMRRNSFPTSLKNLQTLVVEDNPLLCDCQITWLLDSLPSDTKRGVPVCASPPRLAGRMLYNLTVNDLVAWPEDCDKGCTCQCHEDNVTGFAVYVNCSGGPLKQLPGTFPKNSRKLDLSGNGLERLDERLTEKAPDLSFLSLRGNLLSNVDKSTIPEEITVLDLRDNNLKRFPLELVSMLRLTRIWLSGNPWSCDCEDYPFRQWAEGHGEIIQDSDDIICTEGLNTMVSLKPFMEVGQKELCPSVVSKALSYGISILVLAAVALTVSTAYFKYKREIKVWLYARGLCSSLQCIKEDDLDDDKSFDIFLSFSSKDSSWAYEHLIPRVEAHGFTVCTYDRNFKGGFLVQEIIHEAVACSRRTLLLLSENFVQSEWCRWEFRVAHHRALEDNINRLIVVLVDEAASNAVDDELKIYMQATNYLRWGEAHFWDKLLYSLPKKDSQRRLIPNSQAYPMAPISTHI
ncbi:unnamed protein product [Ixodes hexagonus]